MSPYFISYGNDHSESRLHKNMAMTILRVDYIRKLKKRKQQNSRQNTQYVCTQASWRIDVFVKAGPWRHKELTNKLKYFIEFFMLHSFQLRILPVKTKDKRTFKFKGENKENGKRSDSVLWKKPLYHLKIKKKSRKNTKKPLKLWLHNDCRLT